MWKVHCSYCFDCTCVSCSRNNITQLRNLPAAMIQGSTPTLEFSGRMLISQSSWEGVSFSPRYETQCENTPDLKYITYEDLFCPCMDISRIILLFFPEIPVISFACNTETPTTTLPIFIRVQLLSICWLAWRKYRPSVHMAACCSVMIAVPTHRNKATFVCKIMKRWCTTHVLYRSKRYTK